MACWLRWEAVLGFEFCWHDTPGDVWRKLFVEMRVSLVGLGPVVYGLVPRLVYLCLPLSP